MCDINCAIAHKTKCVSAHKFRIIEVSAQIIETTMINRAIWYLFICLNGEKKRPTDVNKWVHKLAVWLFNSPEVVIFHTAIVNVDWFKLAAFFHSRFHANCWAREKEQVKNSAPNRVSWLVSRCNLFTCIIVALCYRLRQRMCSNAFTKTSFFGVRPCHNRQNTVAWVNKI